VEEHVSRLQGRRVLRATWRQRLGRFAVPGVLAGLASTGLVVATSASTTAPTTAASVVSAAPAAAGSRVREEQVSRDVERAALIGAAAKAADERAEAKAQAAAKAKAARKAKAAAKAKAKAARAKAEAAAAQAAAPPLRVVGRRYTRVDLNVRTRPDAGSRLVTVLDSGSRVRITATVRKDWRYISHSGRGAWVRNQYLVRTKPKASTGTSGGTSSAACAGGSAVERGLTRDAVRVHRAICARFPSVRSYGGVRADSLPEHPSGRALDAMISSNSTGWAIANYVRANAKRLGVSQVLFDRRIWTVQRGSEGWRSFGDRGSATANHQDHVHVTVYGNAGR